MVIIHKPINETLKGHKLLLLTASPPAPNIIAGIKERFPDLEINTYQKAWGGETAESWHVPEEYWDGVTIILTGSILPTIQQTPKLQYVQLWSAGADLILDRSIFRDTKIQFCTANGVHGPQISEWVIGTFLALNHNFPKFLQQQQEGRWNRPKENKTVEDAVGKRVGILGYGSIGRQVARVSKAMGMDVHAYTLHPRSTPESRRDNSYVPPGLGDPEGVIPSKWFSGDSTADLHEFLGSDLDFVVVSLPLTAKTRNLISRPEFGVLAKRRTFLTNIARGPIVNTDDLIDALNTESIRGAALDVTDPEPLPEGHPLWHAKNVIVTPHVSGESSAYESRIFEILKQNLGLFAKGRELTNRVSRKDGY